MKVNGAVDDAQLLYFRKGPHKTKVKSIGVVPFVVVFSLRKYVSRFMLDQLTTCAKLGPEPPCSEDLALTAWVASSCWWMLFSLREYEYVLNMYIFLRISKTYGLIYVTFLG